MCLEHATTSVKLVGERTRITGLGVDSSRSSGHPRQSASSAADSHLISDRKASAMRCLVPLTMLLGAGEQDLAKWSLDGNLAAESLIASWRLSRQLPLARRRLPTALA
jgi:hypothetical protein